MLPRHGRTCRASGRDHHDRVQRVIPSIEWPAFTDDIDAILDLKRQRNAVVLAHNYQTPEIFHCVADIVGDSLALARKARTVEADIIVLAGVHFMAETVKLLNPDKTVLIADTQAGCSLAVPEPSDQGGESSALCSKLCLHVHR